MSKQHGSNPPTSHRLDELRVREDVARGRVRRAKAPSPERAYPKMRALLREPESVPYGSEALPKEEVPGTFFPSRPVLPRQGSGAQQELDSLLENMAEGLLIGGDEGTSRSEMRIALRDEFFRGTELIIALVDGEVHARLVPPDLETYRVLEARIDELRTQLADRGLRVGVVEVAEP